LVLNKKPFFNSKSTKGKAFLVKEIRNLDTPKSARVLLNFNKSVHFKEAEHFRFVRKHNAHNYYYTVIAELFRIHIFTHYLH
jgi:hypothetical protein